MRCDTQVFFVTDGSREMVTDPGSADYGSYRQMAAREAARLADVTDTKTETQRLVYGQIREGSRTVRLNSHYREPFDHIRIVDRDTGASRLFDVDAFRHLRHRSVFICHEVK